MDVVDNLYLRTNDVVFYGLMIVRLWAFIDCVTRKAPAFPAADKLTKPAWMAILAVCALFGFLIYDPTGPISLITVVVSAVYLADVRPAVREISGGR